MRKIVEVSYENGAVEKIFSDYIKMGKKIGNENARAVKKHIERLRASVNFQGFLNLRLGKPHSLHGNFVGHYAVSITGNVRLILFPVCKDLSPDSLKACTLVMVKGVGDYHGDKMEWIIP